MTVEAQHPEYAKYLPVWKKCRAGCAGSPEIKAGKMDYLPKPNDDARRDPNSTLARQVDARYRQYIERAIYTNFCGRTVAGLKGAAFRKDPEIDLPAGLEYLEGNANGEGVGLIQLAKDQCDDVLAVGRTGLLVDYPPVKQGSTAEQTQGIEAKICAYQAESIINWKTTVIDGRVALSLVVLCEEVNKSDDEFDHENQKQYRVLRLGQEGYSQQVYNEEGEPVSAQMFPTQQNGSVFDRIPFIFVGSVNNDHRVDFAPMGAMVEVNIGHYRNSADIEENSFIHGQMTFGVTSSLSAEEWNEQHPEGILVGARTGYYLGDSGSFHSAQTAPSSLTQTLMKDKEQQLMMLGAQLITDKNANQTAKAAQLQHASEHTVLGDLVGNLSAAFEQCIEWCGMFMGAEGEITFQINTQFFDEGMDPQQVMAAIQMYDREIIAESDIRQVARKADFIPEDRTDEDIEAELAEDAEDEDLPPLEQEQEQQKPNVMRLSLVSDADA